MTFKTPREKHDERYALVMQQMEAVRKGLDEYWLAIDYGNALDLEKTIVDFLVGLMHLTDKAKSLPNLEKLYSYAVVEYFRDKEKYNI